MIENLTIETRVKRLINYIDEVDNGYIQIPSFQRDFIWENKQKIDLFESIKRGYPIGSLLLWKPKAKYGISDEIGPYILPEPKINEYYYILDGFQRLSTIYGCLKNPNKAQLEVNEKLRKKEYYIFYDLITEEFFIPRSHSVDLTQMPVYTLIDTFEFLTYVNRLQSNYPNKDEALVFLERAQKLSAIFSDFTLPGIEIIGGKIDDAIEIFTRINSKGSNISPDWMLSALTSNENEDFNLGNLINDLLIDLEEYNFGEIKRELIVQCIQNAFGKVYFDTKIEELHNRENFIDVAYNTIESIKKAVKFIFEELLVVSSKLLPYNNQLIFITDFFNQIKGPSQDQLNKLKEWFWQTTYANYFTIYSLSKIRESYGQFQNYLKGTSDEILYNDKPNKKFTVIDFPNKIFFGSVRAKALVLFLLNYSNDFKKIDSNKGYDLKLYNLFLKKNEYGNYAPEGIVPVIDYIEKTKNKNILADFLDKKDIKKYFLSKEMVSLIFTKSIKKEDILDFVISMENEEKINKRNEMLDLRKKLIMKSEKEFTERLGLQYES